jgi:predicted amidophosphoribosyltransferase
MFGRKKDKKKKSLEQYIKDNEGMVCENCRTPVPGNTNLCPKCGLSPGPESMSSYFEPGQIRDLSKKRREEE